MDRHTEFNNEVERLITALQHPVTPVDDAGALPGRAPPSVKINPEGVCLLFVGAKKNISPSFQ